MLNSRANPQTIRRHAIIWLATAGLLAILWLIIWLTGDEVAQAVKKAKSTQSGDKPLPTQIERLNDLYREVRPIDLTGAAQILGGYPDEFKDRSYFEKHRGRWTIQVMNVEKHENILDYLQNRKDREKFAYFRYTDPMTRKEKYILTYGVMHDAREALSVLQSTDFKLAKANMNTDEMSRYLSMIGDYQKVEENEESKPKVELTETKALVAPKPALPVQEEPEIVETPAPVPPSDTPLEKPALPSSAPKSAEEPAKTLPPAELAPPPVVKPTAEAKFTINGNATDEVSPNAE